MLTERKQILLEADKKEDIIDITLAMIDLHISMQYFRIHANPDSQILIAARWENCVPACSAEQDESLALRRNQKTSLYGWFSDSSL